MSVTTFHGVVGNGQIRLHGDPRLSEKAKEYAVIPDIEITQSATVGSARLVHSERATDFE